MRIEKENKLIPVAEVTGVNKPTIHTIHILDGSGSMRGPKFDTAKSGIQEEIETLKNIKDVNYLYTIIEFSDFMSIKVLCNKIPIEDINFDKLPFFNANGGTALYDAIGNNLSSLLVQDFNETVVVKIFTDGGENGSRTFNTNSVRELISKLEDKGVVVTFVGTEWDVKFMVRNLKLSNSNTLSHNNTPEGVKAAYLATMDATVEFSKSVVRGESNTRGFYSQEESNIKK